MAVKSTFSAGKCTKKAAKRFTFPGKNGEMAVKSTFSAGKCTKKAGKWFTSPQNTDEEYRWEQYSRGPADNGSADNANHIKTRDGKKKNP